MHTDHDTALAHLRASAEQAHEAWKAAKWAAAELTGPRRTRANQAAQELAAAATYCEHLVRTLEGDIADGIAAAMQRHPAGRAR